MRLATVAPCPVSGCISDAGQPMVTSDAACSWCLGRIAKAVAELPGLYVRLHTELGRSLSAALDERVSYSPAPPLPLRVYLHDLSIELYRACEGLYGELAAEHHLSRLPGHVRPGWAVQRAVRAVAVRGPRVTVEYGYANVLLDLHGRIRRGLALTNPPVRIPVPCPDCDLRALIRFSGGDRVTCEECGATWTEDEYQRFTVVATSNARRSA